MATPASRPPSDLRDRPFRARARIGAERGSRPPGAIAAVAVAATLVLGLGLLGPRTGDRPATVTPGPLRNVPVDLPTPLPAVVRPPKGSPGPVLLAPIPVLASGGGIRWANPVTGGLTDLVVGPSGRAAAFSLADGSLLCVCLESPWRREGRTVRVLILHVGADGSALGGGRAIELTTPVDGRRQRESIVIDAALDTRHGRLVLARAVRDETSWRVGLDLVDTTDGGVLDSIDIPAPPAADALQAPVVRVSPDGGSVRLGLAAISGGLEDRSATRQVRSDWQVGLTGDRFGEAVALPAPPIDGLCLAEAFISVTSYARVCRASQEVQAPTVALLETQGAAPRPVPLGTEALVDWRALADPVRSRLIVWDPTRHELDTIEADGSFQARYLPDDGQPLDEIRPAGVRPATSWGRLAWGATGSPFALPGAGMLVGSPDGSLVLAAGRPGNRGSTGIWVFDATTFELLERWPPASAYVELAYSPDGGHVYAMGESLVDSFGRPAPWGRTLAIHDAADGALLGMLGAIEGNVATPLAFPMPAE